MPLDRAERIGQRIGMRVRQPGGLQPIGVFLGIAKLERVFLDAWRLQHREAFIEQLRKPRIGPDPAVMVTARTDILVGLILLRKQHFLARRAADPQVVGSVALVLKGQRFADSI